MRVLYIEDNETLADLIKVQYDTFEIETVSSLCAARYRLQNEAFDVLLVDLNLPDSKSVDTVEALLPYRIPLVVITAYPTPEFIAAASKLGVSDYVTKTNLHNVNLGLRLQFAHDKHVKKRLSSVKSAFSFHGMEACKQYISCAETLSRSPWAKSS